MPKQLFLILVAIVQVGSKEDRCISHMFTVTLASWYLGSGVLSASITHTAELFFRAVQKACTRYGLDCPLFSLHCFNKAIILEYTDRESY